MPAQTLEREQNIVTQVETQQIQGLPVDTDIAFSDHKGRYKKRLEKQQRKFLAKLGFLAPFLETDEKILFITPGYSPFSSSEQLLAGALIYQLKRCLFVFTNYRIFHTLTKSNFTYRKSIAQILYADCSSLQIKRSALVANYKNGSSEKFQGIPGAARKKIAELLRAVSFEGDSSPMLERAHLCPRCTKPLVKGYYACPHCSLEFKNKTQARNISIVFPGGGYFYTRHPVIGISNAVVEIMIIFSVFSNLIDSLKGITSGLVIAAFFVLAITADKMMTIFHANMFINEFIALDPNVSPQPADNLARPVSGGPAKGTTPPNSRPSPLPKPEDILRNNLN